MVTRGVGRVVVDDDNFIASLVVVLVDEALERPGQDVRAVVGAEYDRDIRAIGYAGPKVAQDRGIPRRVRLAVRNALWADQ